MELSSELVSEFAKVTNDEKNESKEDTRTGYIIVNGNSTFVKLDGSDEITPVITTVSVKNNDRVNVTIANHKATVIANLTAPAANSDDVESLSGKIIETNTLIANRVTTEELAAEKARIDDLVTKNVTIEESLTASEARIGNLETDNTIINGTLTAQNADISDLKSNYADMTTLKSDIASIKELNTTHADIFDLDATYLNSVKGKIETLESNKASIDDLTVERGRIDQLTANSAQIDFSNITEAAVQKLFTDSGIINDLVMSSGHVTGKLVGVTIKGDLIEGGTVKADKLVVLGNDGLYYKLNTTGESVTAEQTAYNSLNGSVITAQSITAEKVNVDDLVAFDATIGGFQITENSLYSGVKTGIDNVTTGIYMDKTGQFVVGDADNYLKYYKDADGFYKLEITGSAIKIGAHSTLQSKVEEIDQKVSSIKEEMTTNLRIDSSRGTAFKNNNMSTVLSAVIYRGNERITNMIDLKKAMGDGVYLQWSWQKIDENSFGVISATDKMLSDDGFKLTISPNEVDEKCTFMCELITS